jgi:hypothetical protein
VRLNIDWQQPTGSLVELENHDFTAMRADGVDPDDIEAVEGWVSKQLKDRDKRGPWIRRIVDDWTDKSDADFEVIQFSVEDW